MVKIDLVNRTVTNDGAEDLALTELITRISTISPGDTASLNTDTKVIQIT